MPIGFHMSCTTVQYRPEWRFAILATIRVVLTQAIYSLELVKTILMIENAREETSFLQAKNSREQN